MEPFRWRRAVFLGLVSYAAPLSGLVFDTFVPVLLQAGHPLWHNDPGLPCPARRVLMPRSSGLPWHRASPFSL